MDAASHQPPRAARGWITFSNAVLFIELRLAALLLAVLLCVILTNVVTRYAGMPIYWIDELAVIAMVWLGFIGASAMSRLRLDFAITFLAGAVPLRLGAVVRIGGIALVVLFGFALAWMCWLWLDPVGIAKAGFDGRAFAGATFNFVYTETTMTLGWPRWAVMCVIPIFAITMMLHGIASLIEEIWGCDHTAISGFEEASV
ncbi:MULTISPECIES: TRAP transporter small permease [unclassified Yoonia]|uniref:TRAP transporter small permease n=1 Tax=unclassified Yoonia TaxID=2629118 RepID=UPI002AFF47A1|nr:MULTISPECIES: TRAP transporter small permease [unclassified Yoonia]